MFEKNLQIGYLLDFYGDVLSERKRSVMDMYYNEDLSLAEIAAEIGISRQGVRDLIKKSEEELFFYRERSCVLGKTINYFVNGQKNTAEAVGIDSSGGLIVKNINGETITLTSGEISVRLC